MRVEALGGGGGEPGGAGANLLTSGMGGVGAVPGGGGSFFLTL